MKMCLSAARISQIKILIITGTKINMTLNKYNLKLHFINYSNQFILRYNFSSVKQNKFINTVCKMLLINWYSQGIAALVVRKHFPYSSNF